MKSYNFTFLNKITFPFTKKNIYSINDNMNEIVNDICDKVIKDEYAFILISGNGAAGKSTFATVLQNELGRRNKSVQIISTNDFMLDKTYRKSHIKTYIDKNGRNKNDYIASTFPEAYDYNSLNRSIYPNNADITIIEGIGAALITDDFSYSF